MVVAVFVGCCWLLLLVVDNVAVDSLLVLVFDIWLLPIGCCLVIVVVSVDGVVVVCCSLFLWPLLLLVLSFWLLLLLLL